MASFTKSIEPATNPAFHKLGLFFKATLYKDGAQYAMRYLPNEEACNIFIDTSIDIYYTNATPFCIECGCGIVEDDQGICPDCCEEHYQEYLDNMSDFRY